MDDPKWLEEWKARQGAAPVEKVQDQPTPHSRNMRGFGDKHHAALLADGWMWDGEVTYQKILGPTRLELMGQVPSPPCSIEEMIQYSRSHSWDFYVQAGVDQVNHRICIHKNFIFAAAAVTGAF